MFENFYVIKKYNNADSYALAIGLLADRLALLLDEPGTEHEILIESSGLWAHRVQRGLGWANRFMHASHTAWLGQAWQTAQRLGRRAASP
jgi:hypothetical protein